MQIDPKLYVKFIDDFTIYVIYSICIKCESKNDNME